MISDQELLQNYTRNKSEEAFTTLVNRHLGLVYSAAFRQVRSPQLAEEVAQSTFTDLARQAQGLKPDTFLSAWLYQVTRRTAINVVRREARRKLREQAAYELTAMNATANQDWTQIEALLDEGMHTLDDRDRAVILLRYFENKSLHEVGDILGASDNAVQKRISRAVERLRKFFVKRGVTVAANGLGIAISANAVQSAPMGLTFTISTAATLTGTTLATTATAGITKAIAMTTLQKALVAAALVAGAGAGIFEAHRASTFGAQVENLQQQQTSLTEKIEQLQRERDNTATQLAALRAENERPGGNAAELARLRGEVNRLRQNQAPRETTARLNPPRETAAAMASAAEDARELGMAVVRGDAGAFARLLELARAEHDQFNTNNNAGLNDSQRGDLAREAFGPLHAAFKVIAEAAASGDQVAVKAVVQTMAIPELRGSAVQCIGAIAANGNETAMQVLLNPQKYGLLQSGVVGALRPAADNGNQKAIDALSAVARDPNQAALWLLAANGLEKSAESGNEMAIDALAGLSASTNINVRNAVVPGLRTAAAKQNAKAMEALRSLGIE